MDWRNPSLLYWLLPTTLLWGFVSWYAFHRNRVLRSRFIVGNDLATRLLPPNRRPFVVAKIVLQMVGWAALWIAFAGPQWGERWEETQPRGSDLYVLLDVSRSMLASDVPPSRLERAKADIATLTNRMAGERIGLVVFAGKAVVKCPLTIDYDAFRRSLADVDTQSAPRGGTAIGDAIRKALEVFSGNAQRHQAILLITDGDDQESFPLEAAEVAAERNVPIFAVGLGDAATGARIPQKPQSGSFVEYEGEQVWSKLDNSLLEQIATKTSGVYVPAGTKSFDLAEIYSNYLEGRTGEAVESQKRLRRADQFQWFLAFGVLCFAFDTWWRSSSRNAASGPLEENHSPRVTPQSNSTKAPLLVSAIGGLLLGIGIPYNSFAFASNPNDAILRGLEHYANQKYEEARDAFAEASEELEKSKSKDASVAIFDQACTEHRLGNRDAAIELYLKGAMSRNKELAAKSQFNLGRLHVESLQSKIGEKGSDTVPEKDREEIVDLATQSIQAYRNSLELDPSNGNARRNLELVRQWLKVTTDRWLELDRNKRRDETNLFQFLEYLINTEKSLLAESAKLRDLYSLDRHAELRQSQELLLEELPYLNRKIEKELSESASDNPSNPQIGTTNKEIDKETQEAINLLLNWSDASRDHMRQASKALGVFTASKSLEPQRGAVEELERIWDAIAPFEALLARALKDQTTIADAFKSTPESKEDSLAPELDWERWQKEQLTTLQRTNYLAPKAQAALAELEATLAAKNKEQPANAEQSKEGTAESPEDTAKRIEGLKKGIELSPKAAEEMQAAIRSMKQKDGFASGEHTEQARKILEEIAKSQPPPPQNQDQQNQDQQQKDNQSQQNDQQQEQDKSQSSSSENKDNKDSASEKENKKQDDNSSDEDNKKDDSKKDDSKDKSKDKKDGDKEKQKDQEARDDKPKDDKSKGTKPESRDKKDAINDKDGKESRKPATSDRVEDVLRKVREREAQKRERDRQLRARALGRPPVDKDW